MPRGRDMEHAGARVLPSALRASAEMEIFCEAEQDENVIDRIAAAQREEEEREIADLQDEAERVAEECAGTGGGGAVLEEDAEETPEQRHNHRSAGRIATIFTSLTA